VRLGLPEPLVAVRAVLWPLENSVALIDYFDLHYLGHELVARYFEHQHWWLHFVLHVVLVLAPLGITALLGLGLWRWLISRTADMRSGGAPPPVSLPGSSLVAGLFRYILKKTCGTSSYCSWPRPLRCRCSMSRLNSRS
jgi:hypothetical protein